VRKYEPYDRKEVAITVYWLIGIWYEYYVKILQKLSCVLSTKVEWFAGYFSNERYLGTLVQHLSFMLRQQMLFFRFRPSL